MKSFFTTIILAFLIMPLINDNYAQEGTYDLEHTINYINQKLDGVCKVYADKKMIRVEFSNKGKVVRIDQFSPDAIDIDNGIVHSEGEKAIILSCYPNAGKCVDRQILTHDSRLFYDRTNLPTSCTENSCNALNNALNHLIMLYIADDDYVRTKPFEEE